MRAYVEIPCILLLCCTFSHGVHFLFMFVLVEELDSPAYPDDFQEIEVKEEPMEYDAVSCDLF